MSTPKNRAAFIPSSPQMLEPLLIEMRTKLLAHFSWLDESYLIAEPRQAERMDGSTYTYPGVLAGNLEYLNMLPDRHLKNYAYFEASEQDEIDWMRTRAKVQKEIGLIFFFNYKDLYPSTWHSSTIERVKSDVLEFFHETAFTAGQVRPVSFEQTAAEIYAGYDYEEIDRQFLMKPFGALRINLDCMYFQKCP